MPPTQDVWQKVRSHVGVRDSLPEMRHFKPTTFLPTFLTKAALTPVTGLRVGLEMSMEFLKAKLEIGVGLLNLSGDFGPVLSQARPFNPD